MNSRRKICAFGVGTFFALMPVFSAFGAVTAQVLQSDKGMVAAAHPLAARAGAEILEQGGNAIDAAIATSLALGVVEPYASSLFGEGYMVVRMADGSVYSIDFRSAAPAMATYEQLRSEERTIREISGMPQGACVPGLVAGIEAIYAKGATKSLEELAAPAIRYAEEGFEVSPTFAQVCMDNFDRLSANAPDFLNDGFPWEAGDTFRNPALAQTLRTLTEKGLRDFYEGSIADHIEAFMVENGGWIRKSDLQAYEAIEREPLQGSYRGYNITVAGLPVGGPRLLENLNVFENFDFAVMGWDDPLRLHIMQETFLMTNSDLQAHISDPAFNVSPAQGMISKDYAKTRLMKIKLSGATTGEEWDSGKRLPGDPGSFEDGLSFSEYLVQEDSQSQAGEELKESASTTHFSVIDRWGNAVAWTQTISGFFGTGNWIDGFFLNNEMFNFPNTPSGGVSDLVPGKRVRTTIAPMVIEREGSVRWVLGSPGAGRIVPTLSQMIVDLVDFDMTLEESIRAPKIMSSFDAKTGTSLMEMETGFAAETVAALQRGFGYTVVVRGYPDLYFGGPNAIARESDGTLTGVGSIRRGGAASAPEK